MTKKDYLIIILIILATPTVFNIGKFIGKFIATLF